MSTDSTALNTAENLQPILYKCSCKWKVLPSSSEMKRKPLPTGWKLSKENSKQQVSEKERDFNRSLEIQFRDDDSEEDGRRGSAIG